MNIQRKYSLPNCTLLLEGLTDASASNQFQDLRPELAILVNAEFHVSNHEPIAGGREFFESLVRAVSAYAQEFLSNVPNPQAHNLESELVELHKISNNQHQLIVHAEVNNQDSQSQSQEAEQSPIQLDLNTVQLFDLIEAVDQFFADTQTLPELTLELQPVTRLYGNTSEALLKQVVPASVGLSSLAVAAVAFSLIPPPEVRPPEPKPADQTSTNTTPTPSPSPTTAATIETTATNSPTTTPTATPVVKDLESLLNQVKEITDPSQLRVLQRQVYNQINPAWENRVEIREDLVYRLGVGADGRILGYKAVSEKANQKIENTPLPKLLYNPANQTVTNEPIAQFKIVFTRKGELQVSPWRGYSDTPKVIGKKITDPSTIKELKEKLYKTIRQNWGTTITFNRELKYRVAVNKIGIIADYEPLNQVAFDYFRETPLPQMFQSVYGSNDAAPNNKEPLAHFEVVFKPDGTLEVLPWEGYS